MTESPQAQHNGSPKYTVPGLSTEQGGEVAELLQGRLDSLNDLALTLKHAHWNVIGPHFIAVHTMIDPQVAAVRLMVDQIAERIATLGGSAQGTPGGLVERRTWHDYSIGRADAMAHLGALDVVYQGVISAQRAVAAQVEDTDPVTNDLLINQLHDLELFHWFVRAHLEQSSGDLATAGASGEISAATRAGERPA